MRKKFTYFSSNKKSPSSHSSIFHHELSVPPSLGHHFFHCTFLCEVTSTKSYTKYKAKKCQQQYGKLPVQPRATWPTMAAAGQRGAWVGFDKPVAKLPDAIYSTHMTREMCLEENIILEKVKEHFSPLFLRSPREGNFLAWTLKRYWNSASCKFMNEKTIFSRRKADRSPHEIVHCTNLKN